MAQLILFSSIVVCKPWERSSDESLHQGIIIPHFMTTEVSPENCEKEPMSETWSENYMQNILLYIAELYNMSKSELLKTSLCNQF